ncbi:MAG: VWA domain-containing protein [Chloroflexi bacterium]|nr:MAG: VWA domain-containing protein [Chloroflexota bacterium]MBL1196062.1 VWA domain-containing protein [Chloroflexota bacterium]NOH13356.1 VWA domain-containing protein [Chloroflexota bacterium]
MSFSAPWFLLLFLLLPAVIWLGWPSGRWGRIRGFISLAIRAVILSLLILALAGLELNQSGDKLAVVFLVDDSDSMGVEAKAEAAQYVEDAIQEMGPDDQSAVILFGGEALVERPMSANNNLAAFASTLDQTHTNIGEAVQLALALYPSDAARRLVILSDGGNTQGDAVSAAELAAASGVEILYVPFENQVGDEALVTDVSTPASLNEGEQFDLTFTVEASQATQATVRVLAGTEVVHEALYDLDRGEQSFSIPLTAGEPGFVNYSVQLISNNDSYYQNNELASFSRVSGPPKILVVAPPAGEEIGFRGETRPDEVSALLNVLETSNMTYDQVTPGRSPSDLATLSEYSSIILVDVPARELSQRQMEAMRSYVRDLGGGLIAIGGPTSFGVGGYFQTPLEEILPVEMQIKDEVRRPTLTILFVIDRSGSMSSTSGGETKIDLAKEASIRSVRLMAPFDKVGVILFDENASWVVPISEVGDGDAAVNAIGTIRSGGGTDILAGLQLMAEDLPADDSQVKHVVLLTDGGANEQGIPELVEEMFTQYGITLTSVGIGADAASFLADIAELGGGRFYFAPNPASIPSIFTEETTLASRAYLVEEPFFPALRSNSPMLSGITAVPQLQGYVATSAKPAARTILVSDKDDPILASWQYGLGRAVAFTSDASGRWARDWVAWDGYATFWAQAVSFVNNKPTPSSLDVRVEEGEDNSNIIVEAQNQNGQFLNGYSMQANAVGPDGETEEITLVQTAPGQYQAEFTPSEQGAYLLGISGQAENTEGVSATTGWVLSYSPEYRALDSNPDLLQRLAALSDGGQASDNPQDVFAHTLAAPRTSLPIWTELLLLAVLLLPFDIAVRRLVFGLEDVSAFMNRFLEPFLNRPKPLPRADRPESMQALFAAKENVQEQRETPVDKQPIRITEVPEAAQGSIPEPVAETVEAAKNELEVVKDQSQTKVDGGKSTTQILLERKRARRDEED